MLFCKGMGVDRAAQGRGEGGCSMAIGRLGALAVGLGIGAAIAAMPSVAW